MSDKLSSLIHEIKGCTLCEQHLALGPRPVFSVSENSKVWIVGQAPGTKVHASGIPWDDASGKQLRAWLQVDLETFYNPDIFAIVPMGLCYPGKGTSGDLPPRTECAPLWHTAIAKQLPKPQVTILIGAYAQRYYLGKRAKKNLTETVANYKEYLPEFIVLPHPSPRNRFWFKNNPWFQDLLLPTLQEQIKLALKA